MPGLHLFIVLRCGTNTVFTLKPAQITAAVPVQQCQRCPEFLPGIKPAGFNSVHQKKGVLSVPAPGQRPGNRGGSAAGGTQSQKTLRFR